MSSIFVTRPVPEQGIQMLRDAFGKEEVRVFEHDRIIERDELLEQVSGAKGLLSILTDQIDGDVMDAAGESLKVIANYAVGYNNIDVDAATQRGIAVANTPGVLTEATADLAWALLMATARRIGEAERYVRAGNWDGWGPQLFLGAELHGRTLGIFGMGRIGQAVARRARGFDMKILYTKRNRLSAEEEAELGAEFVEKERLVAESDFLSIHCPLTPETEKAFGAAELTAMKATAILVNTSRGQVIDEPALARALHSGEIAGAGLDVFEEEPKIHDDLMTCDNAVLAPHIGSATHWTRGRMSEIAAENIIARLRGDRPPNCVNPEVL
jgi:glyoxylate reductase